MYICDIYYFLFCIFIFLQTWAKRSDEPNAAEEESLRDRVIRCLGGGPDDDIGEVEESPVINAEEKYVCFNKIHVLTIHIYF